jgi:hypothetical protein
MFSMFGSIVVVCLFSNVSRVGDSSAVESISRIVRSGADPRIELLNMGSRFEKSPMGSMRKAYSRIGRWYLQSDARDPINIGSSGSLCTATPAGAVSFPDRLEFVPEPGTINSLADFLSVGLSVLGNDMGCGTGRNYTQTLTLGAVTW